MTGAAYHKKGTGSLFWETGGIPPHARLTGLEAIPRKTKATTHSWPTGTDRIRGGEAQQNTATRGVALPCGSELAAGGARGSRSWSESMGRGERGDKIAQAQIEHVQAAVTTDPQATLHVNGSVRVNIPTCSGVALQPGMVLTARDIGGRVADGTVCWMDPVWQ